MMPWKKIDSQNGSIFFDGFFVLFKKSDHEKRRKSTDFLLALNGL